MIDGVVAEVVAIMVGWHSMDSGSTGESWIDGLDWTPVEVGNRASLKVTIVFSDCLKNVFPAFFRFSIAVLGFLDNSRFLCDCRALGGP